MKNLTVQFYFSKYLTVTKWAEKCAAHVSSVNDFVEMIDYNIEDVLTLFTVGDLKVKSADMSQYWHKVLDYRNGFCYTFDPPPISDIKLSTDALNMALLLLDVSYAYNIEKICTRSCISLGLTVFDQLLLSLIR